MRERGWQGFLEILIKLPTVLNNCELPRQRHASHCSAGA